MMRSRANTTMRTHRHADAHQDDHLSPHRHHPALLEHNRPLRVDGTEYTSPSVR